MPTHSNAEILRLVADGHPVQWRAVNTEIWHDFDPGKSLSPNPLVPDTRVIWREKPKEVTISGVVFPVPLPANAELDPNQTYYVASLDGVRGCWGSMATAQRYLESCILHSTVDAARLHSTALQRLNESFFR